jgi:hypothetical protein
MMGWLGKEIANNPNLHQKYKAGNMKIINNVKDDAIKWLFMNLFEIIHKGGTLPS